MMRGVLSALSLVALSLAVAALPAAAQGRAAAEIVLIEGAAPVGVTVLGDVRAEIHQTSLLAKTPARDLVDSELREQAAKLGADAVVNIRYESNAPLFSKKGFRAAGKAVKFNPPPVQVATASPAPAPEPGKIVTFTLTRDAAAAPVAPTVSSVQPVAPPPQIVSVAPPPVPAAPPVVQPVVVAPAAVPAPPRAPTPEALIVLTADDLQGRAYERLGEVSAVARQTSLFPAKSARAMIDEELRAGAAALGADAVILIRYQSSSPLLSKRGSSATGIAVKFR